MRMSRATLVKMMAIVSLLVLSACDGGLGISTDLESQSEDSISTWQNRLENQLVLSENNSDFSLKRLAGTGNQYNYGRTMNNGLTSLTAAYRINRDPDTARYIRDVMAIVRNQLKDEHMECPNPNNTKKGRWECDESQKTKVVRDGYLNFVYSHYGNSTDLPFNRTDWHVMDEILSHAALAGAAYTLKEAGYTTDANYWTNYLKNHFEAKWRQREGKPSSFPFLFKGLFHPYVQWIRYHYYMGKLTGDSAYHNEAKRMAGHARNFMLERSDGGYTWGHHFAEGKKSTSDTCQTTVYIRLTMQAFQDLNMMDKSLFSDTFMSKVARTMATRVVGSNWQSMTNDVCGNGTYSAKNAYGQYPYAAVAPWDSSGKLERLTREAYTSSTPTFYTPPAMMILRLGR